ncbi:hypothetical protein BT67DRAFT_120059 [Trichocladium antarcticum]|uniref:Uncharacterized protein n=1 Tax=Trichocladium antarcticum TaxID=1450529 RepID=A0AAN6URJ8_9PEZI|nr:hypothetical protein BT67DRAFT_431958 [Trichocladium antarcticum]KAK4137746.1 hypothetical protein BT67DRAFT_120059 [Trichocladium antarcticum]
MVPTPEMPPRGRSPARSSDELDDDDWTVYSGTESISDRSIASVDSSLNRHDTAPVFRLKKGEQDRAVYEAWNIQYVPDRRTTIGGFKALGVKVERFEDGGGRIQVGPRPSTQSELARMHLNAIEDFKAKHTRCLAARAIRGKAKTYEQDLEARSRELPHRVRAAAAKLLHDRGKAASTCYRTRTWTVVAMREQLRCRFSEADYPDVKRHKFRFWKNRHREEPLLYALVIRGAETAVCAEEDGVSNFAPFSNPWVHADSAETGRKSHARHLRQESLRRKRHGLSPPNQAARERSVSPPSYRSSRSFSESPAPTIRNPRDQSPPPYWSRQAHSSVRSRSPSVRVRVMPRFDDTLEAMSVPTPPESFTPPPGVSAYSRPPMGPMSFPAIYHGPFHPQPPLTATGLPPPFRYPARPMPGSPFGPHPFDTADIPAAPATCVGCRSTLPHAHYSRLLPSHRPPPQIGNPVYHPTCTVCARHSPPPMLFSPDSGPYDPPPGPAYLDFPSRPSSPPPPPRFPPLSTPSLSSRSSWSIPLAAPQPPTSPPQSAAPELRAESTPESPRGSQAGGGPASLPGGGVIRLLVA